MPGKRMRLMGAPMDVVTEAQAVRSFVESAQAGRGNWTITANLDHIRRYRDEPLAKQLMDEADLVVADGMPLIWASRLAGEPLPERVSGSNMVWSICEAAGALGLSVFLLGGDDGVAERAAAVFQAAHPELRIAGTACPPVGFERAPREIDRVRGAAIDSGAHIVFVALGFPKQDVLIRGLRASMPGTSFMGVGISLSYVTGDLTRAPEWLCNLGLEWAHRLSQEPTPRLLRRYVVNGMPYGLRMMTSAVRRRSHRRASDGSRESPWA